MAQPSIGELIATAAATDEPAFVERAEVKIGGVDPLGLRQINFDLMDEVMPGLNNVARHVRPFVVVAWAWRRALQLAKANGSTLFKATQLQDFVDRIEVMFVLSQMLRDKNVDLPGREYFARWLEESPLTFGGRAWKERRDERKYSTALSAPIYYGPGLRMLGWVRPDAVYSQVMLDTPEVASALDSLEAELEPALKHEAFCVFGSVTVTRSRLKSWSDLWSLDKITPAEADVMSELLMGASAVAGRRLGMNLMLAASAYEKSTDVAILRAAMAGAPAKFKPPRELIEIRDVWRAVQVRQLFRLSLESLFYWTMLKLGNGVPWPIDALVREFLGSLPSFGKASSGEWIRSLISVDLGPTELITRIQQAFESENHADLPLAIARGLAFCMIEPNAAQSRIQQSERLPIARAQLEAGTRTDASVAELMRHVLESWVLAQHAYWSVGRGLADARAGGRMLLRLRVILDEGGWILAPGASSGNPPQPTPDRLETLISLAQECRLFKATQLS